MSFFIFAEDEWVYEFFDPEKNRFGEYTGITFDRHVFFNKGRVVHVEKKRRFVPWLYNG